MKCKVVVCLTTIPSRVEYLIHPLKSLQEQTHHIDKVFLFIPQFSKRENQEYPEIIFSTKKLEPFKKDNKINIPLNMNNLEIVKTQEDYGPITKLYPVTKMTKKDMGFEEEDKILVITIDDDRNYRFDTISSLVKAYSSHEDCCAVGINGWIYGNGLSKWVKIYSPENPVQVDWLEASYGACYDFDFLKKIGNKFIDFSTVPEAKMCEDMWICYLLKHHTKKNIYIVQLPSYSNMFENLQEIQPSTPAKFINPIHHKLEDHEKENNKNPSIWDAIYSNYRNIKVANKLQELDPNFLSAPLPENENPHRDFLLYQIILYIILILSVLVIIFLSLFYGFRLYFRNKKKKRIANKNIISIT